MYEFHQVGIEGENIKSTMMGDFLAIIRNGRKRRQMWTKLARMNGVGECC
jgi:hypothetical protein